MQEIMETGKQKVLYYPKELYYDKNELDSCPHIHLAVKKEQSEKENLRIKGR